MAPSVYSASPTSGLAAECACGDQLRREIPGGPGRAHQRRGACPSPVTIAGKPQARFLDRSLLIDLYPPNEDYPNGFALNISDSIFRMRYRDSWEKPEMMEPGKVYKLSFPMYPTGNLFKKGHRIRVDISSSNFPRFERNPNTGNKFGQDAEMRVAHQQVFHDKTYASHIILPVIPKS